MSLPSTKAERDANLDELKKAFQEYADREEQRLDKETQFLQSILQARGASSVGALNLRDAVTLLQDEVAAFLQVEE